MKTTTRPPARRTSSFTPFSFSESDPRSAVPATSPATSSSSTIASNLGGSVGPLTGMWIVEAGKKPGMRREL
jgi:hypothetical protein